MKFHFSDQALDQIQGSALIALADKGGEVICGGGPVAELIAPMVKSGEFGKSLGKNVLLYNPAGYAAERLIVVNVGEKVNNHDDIRRATAKAAKRLREQSIDNAVLSVEGLSKEHQRAALEGVLLADYQYTELKSEKDKLPTRLASLTIHGGEQADLTRWITISQGTARARDLGQMPANVLYPEKMVEIAKGYAEEFGFKIDVMSEQEIKDAGMGCMHSVGYGSIRESQFMIMEYEPENPTGKTIVMVGKAVCFDTGGISLKPSNAMAEMKGDMCGGATVLGAMSVLRDTGCRHRVIGLVPAVENMPSERATRPSDVVTSLSGLTVEINNTDAEGRLIMADALTYAAKYEPDYVVDFATLTGACLVALGPYTYAVMGNHQPLVDAILEAGEEVHEPFWQLPLVDAYNEFLKSNVADVSNISSSRFGGTITAGLFLQKFAKDYQWAHCDIAACMMEKNGDYHPAGANGAGVRMIIEAMDKL